MNNDITPSYFKYWGKAAKDGTSYHLLVYHCLDVAAVASAWWNESPFIRKALCFSSSFSPIEMRAWVLFFISIHDIGKFDIRFQRKVLSIWKQLQETPYPSRLSTNDSQKYYHGPAGMFWVDREFDEIVMGNVQNKSKLDDGFFDFGLIGYEDNNPVRKSWMPWIEAVSGHHGHIITVENNTPFPLPSDCPKNYANHDMNARKDWLEILETIFLKPAGLSLKDAPPVPSSLSFIAGFCSVVDWLGSANSNERFCFQEKPSSLIDYFENRHDDAHGVLRISGLIGKRKSYTGVKSLLKQNNCPHQVQTLVDNLSCLPGLTIIEAPTGSGKTEAALAYAWRMLDQGQLESIVFALPTQATANAMLSRLEHLSTRLFEDHPNILLAHGNAKFNENFAKLRESGHSSQDESEEAWAQCSEWLAQSRKRAFLGQIGVCTIDQVLTSVLPVKHRFIRSFGLGRSILIVDEVHAYDTYMYGLLKAVLAEQKAAGGSAVLLSATLPHGQRRELLQSWENRIEIKRSKSMPPYPLISQLADHTVKEYQVDQEQMPQERSVIIEPDITKDLLPDQTLKERIIRAAESCAHVVLICNLVDVAQQLYTEIISETSFPVLLFHSRFTLTDRQEIEKTLINRYGDNAERSNCGSILIATQVVEQSLDVDFDWMITQLCPGDLLFQRIGRLHRHPHKDSNRPESFKSPCCTVLIPDGIDYGYHGLIYGNTRVMWRTAYKILGQNDQPLVFPAAYRDWVESIYHETPWGNEPPEVEDLYQKYLDQHQCVQKLSAQMMLNSTKNMTPFMDDDQHIAAVTRDGEMSLTLVPYILKENGRILRDHTCWDQLLKEKQPEAMAMNKVSVPHSWITILDKHCPNDDGIYWMKMDTDKDDEWRAHVGPWELRYTQNTGLVRIK